MNKDKEVLIQDQDQSHFVLSLINSRQNVAPKRLVVPGPSQQQLEKIFSAAVTAPDHGLLQPWRFILIPEHKRDALGTAFVNALKERDLKASQVQIESAYTKAFRAPCVMICVLSNKVSQPHIPKNERLISLGCALQNMLLMARSMSIGCGITSGQSINSEPIRKLFQLSSDEEGICFLNFGTVKEYKPKRPIPNPSSFFSSL